MQGTEAVLCRFSKPGPLPETGYLKPDGHYRCCQQDHPAGQYQIVVIRQDGQQNNTRSDTIPFQPFFLWMQIDRQLLPAMFTDRQG